MPQLTTGWEPDTSQGWNFIDDRVFAQDPPGTQVVSGYQDSRVVAVAGFDLWGSISMDDIASHIQGQGKTVYYLSVWRNPPNPFIGFDDYRVVTVVSP